METTYLGAVDTRSDTDKARDFSMAEIKTYGVVTFESREPIGYTVRNQDGSGSCVAQTTAKMEEIWDYRHDNDPTIYSATPIYQNRRNRPTPGMNYVDALGYPINKGVFLESNVPSQNMSDGDMDALEFNTGLVQPERPTAYGIVPTDFYAVAQEIQDTGAVMMWVKCSYEEWCQDIPAGNSGSEAVRHSITAVDKIMWAGTEYNIVEDSWGTWQKNSDIPLKPGQRAITKQFFDQHCYFAGAFTAFDFVGGLKPRYQWTVSLRYGQGSDKVNETDIVRRKQQKDIKAWQEVLKYEKFFPSNQECTGYFGGITARATVKWQIAHKFYDFQNETDMRRVTVGPKSIREANRLYL